MRNALYSQITEKVFTQHVIQLARQLGWLTAHFRPAKTQRGNWVTAVQGDGAGFPDLVLVRNGRLIFAELKSKKGALSVAQQQWIARIREANIEVHVWKPEQWGEIVECLD